MKAIIHTKYGSPSLLEYGEVPKPIPKRNEVLVKVLASSINSWDWDLVTGKPRIYRLMFGVFKPKHKVVGIDIAGMVEQVGNEVTMFKVGDAVFGDISNAGFGAFAQYACAPETLLALKPGNASFTQAAALPHGGVLALQSVQCNGELQQGQSVLINGAGGCTGTLALQMAKQRGATVTCVDSGLKRDLLLNLGADVFLDYTEVDFTKNEQTYDLVIDLVCHKSIFKYKRIVAPNGALTIVGGKVGKLLQFAFLGALMSKLWGKKMGILIHKPCTKNLQLLKQMYEQEHIKAIIDSVIPLNQVPNGIQKLGDGKTMGKIVVKVN